MIPVERFLKDPSAILDYGFDWEGDSPGPYLVSGETIIAYTITVDEGLTLDSDSESSGFVTVWLSGGTVRTSYTVACKITTSLGRTDERSIEIFVDNR